MNMTGRYWQGADPGDTPTNYKIQQNTLYLGPLNLILTDKKDSNCFITFR